MGAPGQRPLMLFAASLWCFVAALPTARAFDRAPTWKSVARVLPSSPSLSPPFDERFETWFFEWHQGYSQEEVAEIACNMLRCLNDMFDLDSFIAAMNASHSLRTDSSTASTGAIWPIDTINGKRVSGADLPIVISIGDPASDVVTVNQHGKGTTGHEELLQTTGIATSPRIEFKVLHPRGRPWSPVNAEVLVALSGMALLVMGGVAVASVLKRRRTRGQYKLVAGVAKVETRA
ncbi:uncharacterized protein LOC116952351 isoform X1 [Petromyzon marinus]|uniref:Uncharacterized protein LOC116952351 n=1 Tax=Petromyzon marinus TaxID=7757 RepID=A0AAJ7U0E8_PETMA|nr:uncharacterized protein LOC116952351 [Petromyzon marinus]